MKNMVSTGQLHQIAVEEKVGGLFEDFIWDSCVEDPEFDRACDDGEYLREWACRFKQKRPIVFMDLKRQIVYMRLLNQGSILLVKNRKNIC
jgi:hypothetical protein